MMRKEFTATVKRAAIRRSQGRCEAVGKVYGLPKGVRCETSLGTGVEFDHYPVRAADGGDNSLANCMAVCRTCHRFKTRKYDAPNIAKSKRIRRARAAKPRRQQSSFQTNRLGPFKRLVNGVIVPR